MVFLSAEHKLSLQTVYNTIGILKSELFVRSTKGSKKAFDN